jgi:hypothetical protein
MIVAKATKLKNSRGASHKSQPKLQWVVRPTGCSCGYWSPSSFMASSVERSSYLLARRISRATKGPKDVHRSNCGIGCEKSVKFGCACGWSPSIFRASSTERNSFLPAQASKSPKDFRVSDCCSRYERSLAAIAAGCPAASLPAVSNEAAFFLPAESPKR